MEKTNIERFDEFAASILSALYERFPEPTYIDPRILGMSEEEPARNELGGVVYSDEWNNIDEFANHTAKWLAEEGYLSERSSGHHGRYTLSAVGLKSLRHVDQPDIGSATLGEKIKKASTEGARSATSKLIDQFLTVGGPLLEKAMGID